MMRLEWLRHQMAYDRWANADIVRRLGELPAPPPRGIAIQAHIVSAEYLWYERVSGQKFEFPVWPDWSIEETGRYAEDIGLKWRDYLEETTEALLELVIRYANTKQESFTNRVGDILTHLMYHGAYHRGQVALLIRQSDVTPPYTDYIHAVRNGLIEE